MKPNYSNDNYFDNDNRAQRNNFERNNFKNETINNNLRYNLNNNYDDKRKDNNISNPKNKIRENEINNFSKTASEFKNFNKNTEELNRNRNLLVNRENAVIKTNQQNLMWQHKNSDFQREFLIEEIELDCNNKQKNQIILNKFSKTASNFNLKNKNLKCQGKYYKFLI